MFYVLFLSHRNGGTRFTTFGRMLLASAVRSLSFPSRTRLLRLLCFLCFLCFLCDRLSFCLRSRLPGSSPYDERTRVAPIRVENRLEILRDLLAFEDDARVAIVRNTCRRKILTADDNGFPVDHKALVVHVGKSADAGRQIDALILHFLTPLFRVARADDEPDIFLGSDLFRQGLQQHIVGRAVAL